MGNVKTIFLMFLFLIAALLCTDVSSAHDLVWPGEKLKTLVPEADSFEQKNLYVSETQQKMIEERLGVVLPPEDLKPSVYLSIVRTGPDARPRKTSAMMFIDAFGNGGKIEMGVVVNGKGELQKILLFENDEAESLNDKTFLGQFEGKKPSDSFTVGVDIVAPKGNEKSAQAIASGAKRGLVIINTMFGRR
jgi:hypothetical protein